MVFSKSGTHLLFLFLHTFEHRLAVVVDGDLLEGGNAVRRVEWLQQGIVRRSRGLGLCREAAAQAQGQRSQQ
jgi:hypothetical protein